MVFLGAFVLGLALTRRPPAASPRQGVLAPSAPVQGGPGSQRPWSVGEYRFFPLARFHVEARVLSVVRYRFGREADVSPMDFVLGWGPMSDDDVLGRLDIRHANRFYGVSSREPPLPLPTLMEHSANVHLIPADDEVHRALRGVDEDDVVRLSGKLVKIEGPGGEWSWVSSLSRKDSGCEILWVETVERR